MSGSPTGELATIEALADAPIVLPEDPALLTADYARHGEDLVIQTADGGGIVVAGYFALAEPVDLIVSGAAIAGRVVSTLARPVAERGDAETEASPEMTSAGAEAGAEATAAAPTSITPGEPIGAIGEIHGEAFAQRADGSVVPLKPGDPVFEDDLISTGPDASVGIAFSDGMVFSLGAEARLVLDEFRYDAATNEGGGLFSVLAGEFSFVSGAAAGAAEDALMIETPTMTIGVRGTKVVSQIGADGETSRIALLAEEDGTVGKIMVMTDAGEQLIDQPNSMVEIASRFEAPTPAREIASEDVLTFFGDALESLPAPKEFFTPKADAPDPAPASPFAAVQRVEAEARAAAVEAEAAVQTVEATVTLSERMEAAEAEMEAAPEAGKAGKGPAPDFTTVAKRLQEKAMEQAPEEAQALIDAVQEKLAKSESARKAVAETVEEARVSAQEALSARADLIREEVAERAADAPALKPRPEPGPAPKPEPPNSAPVLEAANDRVLVFDRGEGSPEGKFNFTSLGKVDGHTVWRMRNDTDQSAEVVLRAAGGGHSAPYTLDAGSDTIVLSPIGGGEATHIFDTPDRSLTRSASDGVSSFASHFTAPSFPLAIEDAGATSTSVDKLVRKGAITDADGAVEAIAVTTLGAGGTWAFSLDGVSFTDFPAVSETAAVLLGPDALVRFTPNENFFGETSLTYRAWDQSVGRNGQTGVDVSVTGGTTAFSSGTETSGVVVFSSNDAPVLDVSADHAFATVTSDGAAPAAQTVAEMLADGAITDSDGAAYEGVAITAVDDANGLWEYSVDGGTTFVAVAPVGADGALLLRPTDQLRFTPTEGFEGAADITFRAWDASAGDAGQRVDVTDTGGVTAFSADAATSSVAVSAPNTAPVLGQPGAYDFNGVNDVINAGDNEALDLKSGDMTVEAWFYFDGVDGAKETIFSKGGGGPTDLGYSADIENGALVLRLNAGDNGTDAATAATHIDLGTEPGWRHVALVVNQTGEGAMGGIKGYLDGSDVGWASGDGGSISNALFTTPNGGINATDGFMIGASQEKGGANDHFGGAISDVRVWSTARTWEEVREGMASPPDGSEPGLVAHWPLDEGAGDALTDGVSSITNLFTNDPTYLDPATLSVAAGGTISGRLTAADAEGDDLTHQLTADGAGTAAFDANTGVWTYTASTLDAGPVTLTYQVTDTAGATSSLTFDLTVN